MPIRDTPAKRSMLTSVSAHTRSTMEPTVRQEIRINSPTADFEQCVANQATV